MQKILLFVFAIFSFIKPYSQSTGNISFTSNEGQWDNRVKYYGQLNFGGVFLEEDGYTMLLHNPVELQSIMHRHHEGSKNEKKGNEPEVLHSHAYRVQFLGANKDVKILPEKAEPGFSNYFIGNDPSHWATHCNSYTVITYKNIYPNIDFRFYSNEGQLKYDFIVYPGGDVKKIVLKFEGMDELKIEQKQVVIRTSIGNVKELAPFAYQYNGALYGRAKVNCSYKMMKGNVIQFRTDEYLKDETLIIDPTLIFATFSGSKADNWGFSATSGPAGTTYFAGIVFGTGFPVSTGAIQTNYAGGNTQKIDIGIMKLSADGTTRMYATYLGGSGDEYPHSLISDEGGNLIVLGRTYSNNYPVTTPFVGPGGGSDIIVTKLSADGASLIGSMQIGGTGADGVNIEGQHQTGNHRSTSLIRNYGDDSRSEVILDAANNIYVAANTQSANFPVTSGVFQSSFGGGLQDGVLMKINPACNKIIYSSFIGGSKEDGAFVLALQPVSNDIYVAGATASADFPGNIAASIQPSFAGGIADGFIAIVSNDGTTLKKKTYLGTPSVDIIYGIQFDKAGFPYVMGTTRGDWPVLNATFVNAGAKQFVSKLQPDLSAFVYSTTFGSKSALPNISPVAFMVDRCENVYVSGWGGYIITGEDPYGQSGTLGMPVTPDAIKKTTDGYDFYFIVIKKNASQLLYGTFYGQNGGNINDHVDGGTSRYDVNGVIYQAICANCGGGAVWPTTPGSWSPRNGSKNCNLAVVKIAFDFTGVGSGVKAFHNNTPDSSNCAPFTVTLKDTVLNAVSYAWDFGDGSPPVLTTNASVVYTYSNVGVYKVRLIAIDSTTCNIRDTSYTTIIVRDDQANLAFRSEKILPCQSLAYKFENLSNTASSKSLNDKIFIWDFGDGIRQSSKGLELINHNYYAPGTYKVHLILTDTSYCNTPDSIEQTIRISPLAKAVFTTPSNGCAPYEAVFNNSSLGGQSFSWDFGDGTSSTDVNPIHDYVTGVYKIRLIVTDSASCNISDTSYQTITVVNKPAAGMSHTPQIPEVNKPVIFFNTSTGADRYVWLFGDGDSLQTTSVDTVMHQYNATGTFDARLIAINKYGCADTAHHAVKALVVPVLDVPNAFTPRRFGVNSIVQVKGFGIAKMTFRIYNRWGEKVFETNNTKAGWDGTYKGALQPMDVYAYTLDVVFFDGTKAARTGDITLIR